ncbi:unnamed protein product [Ceratitis capitata]|uniref:(Mediterranean fruit fly) hypothetical protein n=1 Tax=Ceratitis capitata TaxID=7213 RepID=A0A811USM1_CERCA|nr:unnamed protein product [Ceratitis capitata]
MSGRLQPADINWCWAPRRGKTMAVTTNMLPSSSKTSLASPTLVHTFVKEIANFEVPCAAPSPVIIPTASSSSPRGDASRTTKSAICQPVAVHNQKLEMKSRRLSFEERKFQQHMDIEDKKLELETRELEFEKSYR